MTVLDAHKSIYRHIGVSLELHELHGKPVAVDIAWWKLRAWWVDTPSFYRPGAEQTHGYRETLARLLSVLSHCNSYECACA